MKSEMPPDTSPETSPETSTAAPPAGQLLTDAQIARLRRAVIVMTALLVAGFALVIGRVIYLASRPATQAAQVATDAMPQPALLADARLVLPAGAEIRHMALAGSRLAVHHGLPGGGESIVVFDLATGAVISRVTVDRGR